MSIVVIISWRGEMNMKKLNYHLYLTDDEYSQVIHSLIELKNNLIQAGKYTDVVDDLLVRLISAKKKNIKIRIKK
jgi:non-homologous end joining protein Ku